MDSLILPISSCEVVKANHQHYKNCEIHLKLVDLEISLIPLDFSIKNPMSVSLIYPVSHLEERYNSSVFVGLEYVFDPLLDFCFLNQKIPNPSLITPLKTCYPLFRISILVRLCCLCLPKCQYPSVG